MDSPIDTLFARALGLEKPWFVAKVAFSPADRKIDIDLHFPRGSRFKCPKCGRNDATAYDTTERTWRHLNFFQHQTFLHGFAPRVNCPDCGIKTADLPWARPESGFTLFFEAMIMMLVSEMPVAAVARIVGEHDTRLWRIMHHYVDSARKEEIYPDTHRIGVDETACKRGHNYVSVVVDLDTSKVIFAVEGKSNRVIGKFCNDFHDHGGYPDEITDVSCDMSPAFIEGVEHSLPDARITFDRFHVMKLMNDAVDKVRRMEQCDVPLLKKSRWVWLKNPETLTIKQQDRLKELSRLNLKTAQAYQFRLNLREFWTLPYGKAAAFLRTWCDWALSSGMEPIRAVALMILDHWDGILNFTLTRITNGVLEGINGLIQAARAKARGYRSIDNFITMIYLIAGKLKFALPI